VSVSFALARSAGRRVLWFLFVGSLIVFTGAALFAANLVLHVALATAPGRVVRVAPWAA